MIIAIIIIPVKKKGRGGVPVIAVRNVIGNTIQINNVIFTRLRKGQDIFVPKRVKLNDVDKGSI